MIPYFRGVVWPRGEHESAPGKYRYTVIGMLITDRPIEQFERALGGEVVLSGNAWALPDALVTIPRGVRFYRTGDASDVLTSLGDCIGETVRIQIPGYVEKITLDIKA